MNSYKQLLADIWQNGDWRETRSGLVCSVFGRALAIDLAKGFPILTLREMNFNNIVGELLWFLNGYTDLPNLRRLSCKPEGAWTIWSDDCKRWHKQPQEVSEDDCGKIYGHQWRNGIHGDQILKLIKGLKEDPYSRYHIVQTYNPSEHKDMALPACHSFFQCYVRCDTDGKPRWLDLSYYCRSQDVILGTPYNIASYALLTHILAKLTGLLPGKLIANLGDTHIYNNHTEGLLIMGERVPKKLPKLVIPNFTDFDQVLKCTAGAFVLKGYNSHPPIKFPLSVGV